MRSAQYQVAPDRTAWILRESALDLCAVHGSDVSSDILKEAVDFERERRFEIDGSGDMATQNDAS